VIRSGLILTVKNFTQRRYGAKNKKKSMTENELSKIILDVAFDIHKKLGPGLLESVYEEIMNFELVNEYGLFVTRQKPIPVIWKTNKLDLGFRSDLIIENKVLVELKSIEAVAPVHFKQVLTILN
jgi:GxxExxY protein